MKHFTLLLALLFAGALSAQKILIHPAQITGSPTAAASFDGLTTTAWFPGWATSLYPARCTVTLDRPYKVSKIRVFDGTGATTFRAYANGAEVLRFPLGLYQTWQEHAVNTTAQTWVFEMAEAMGSEQCPEIELYGHPDGESGPTNPPPAPPVVVKGDAAAKIGTNTHTWVPLSKLAPLHRVRAYISTGFIWRPDGIYIEPFWRSATPGQGYGLDTYLRAAKAAGIEVTPCFLQTPEWFRPTGRDDGANNFPPIRPGLNRTDPASYREVAEFFFQISARYGRRTWLTDWLKLAGGPVYGSTWIPDNLNPPVSGLNLLTRIGAGNELDSWWLSGDAYMQPEETAAYLVAVYEAIKAGDSTMQVVSPALTGFDMAYLHRMDNWLKLNNGGRWPCDILDVHHYSNRLNQAGHWPPTWAIAGGCAPELDPDFETFRSVVAFARARGLKVSCSEFGYDDHPAAATASWQYPVPVPGVSAAQLKADWLCRSILLYLAAGADEVYLFTAQDEPSYQSGGTYTSSGILTAENTSPAYAPKPSYYAVAGLVRALEGYAFAADRSTPTARILEFQKGRSVRYFYWSPTASNRTQSVTVAGRNLTATESVQHITVTRRLISRPPNPKTVAVESK